MLKGDNKFVYKVKNHKLFNIDYFCFLILRTLAEMIRTGRSPIVAMIFPAECAGYRTAPRRNGPIRASGSSSRLQRCSRSLMNSIAITTFSSVAWACKRHFITGAFQNGEPKMIRSTMF